MQRPERVATLVDFRKEGLFPRDGKTLLINGVGIHGAHLMARFAHILQSSRAEAELFGASVSGVRNDTIASVRQILRTRNPFHKSIPVFTDPQDAAEASIQRTGGNLHTAIHFVSYENGPDAVRETLAQYKESLTTIFHAAVVYKPSNPIDLRDYQNGVKEYPPEAFGMPAIILDEGKMNRFLRSKNAWMDTETIFLHGLVGLVTGPRLFPGLNKHDYRSVLETLAEGQMQLGASVGFREIPLVKRLGGLQRALPEQELAQEAEGVVLESLKSDNTITLHDKGKKVQCQVVVMQLPLDPRYPLWKNNQYFRSIEEAVESLAGIPGWDSSNLVYVYSHSPLLGRSDNEAAAIVATHLFPGNPEQKKTQKTSGRPRSGRTR